MKTLVGSLVGLLALAGSPACVHQPPAGTYSAQGTKAFNADQILKDLQALSETAINLNATSGAEHLSDANTRIVRDLTLTTGAAVNSYGTGATTLDTIKSTYALGVNKLSTEAVLNPKLTAALGVIQRALDALPAQ